MAEPEALAGDAAETLAMWGLAPGEWRATGSVTTALEGATYPIVEIAGQRYVLRQQPPDLSEDDTRFRHALMRALAHSGLPVPALLPRPNGYTYVVTDTGIYELQAYVAGERYVSGTPDDGERIAAAAVTLGRLHQASAGFAWQPHIWPEERSASGIAEAYLARIAEAAERETLPASVRAGLARVAEECARRLDAALDALEADRSLPALHIHGDYQPHNLAFGAHDVAAIYDFNAARWERRIDELAYGLLYFAAVRWDEMPTVTPPLVDDGLDVLRAQRFLAAYGDEAPPDEGEARLLGDALALAFPVVFANGLADDLLYPDDSAEPPDEEDALARIQWAETFWLWLDRYRDTLAEAWEGA
ncbi:MAG: phosphotransferase [Ktedonobacterales bacterium]